jgi:hypothetical protein
MPLLQSGSFRTRRPVPFWGLDNASTSIRPSQVKSLRPQRPCDFRPQLEGHARRRPFPTLVARRNWRTSTGVVPAWMKKSNFTMRASLTKSAPLSRRNLFGCAQTRRFGACTLRREGAIQGAGAALHGPFRHAVTPC